MPDDYSNEIADLAMRRAMGSLSVSKPSPDAAAKANRISRTTGLPAATVDDNLASLEQQVAAARARAVVAKNPQLQSWIANPRNAAVSSDDIDPLYKNAIGWASLVKDKPGSLQETGAAPTFWNGVKGVFTSLEQGGVKALSSLRLMAVENPGPLIPGGDLLTALVPQQFKAAQRQRNAETFYAADAEINRTTPGYKSNLARYLYSGASSIAQMIPSVGAAIATKNPAVGLAVAGLQTGVPAYGKYAARGATPQMAALGALGEGGIEVVTEKLPMGFVVDKLGKVGASRFLAGLLGREIPGEIAATLGQNAVDTAIANPTKTWGQYWAEQPDQIASTVVGTIMAGGILGGVDRVASRFEARDAINSSAFEDADALGKAMDSAANSKTRARDPEAFKKFIERFTEGSRVENVFVPAEALATYFQSNDMDYREDDFWRDYAPQIDEGLTTGGDVVIPTADAAAHLSGTPTWEAIKSEVRTSPGGPSLSEVESQRVDYEQSMEQMGAQVAEELAKAKEADAPRGAIYQDIRDKLTNAGYTQDAAHVNAELVAQRYATRAERTGKALKGDETQHISINAEIMGVSKDGPLTLKALANKGDKQAILLKALVDRAGFRAEDFSDVVKSVSELSKAESLGSLPPLTGMLSNMRTAILEDPKVLNAVVGLIPVKVVNDLFGSKAAAKVALHDQAMLKNGPAFNAKLPVAGAGDAAAPVRLALLQVAKVAAKLPVATVSRGRSTKGGTTSLAQELGQVEYPSGVRALVNFSEDLSTISVSLFQERNLSSFLHEMGHVWLMELRADALHPKASDQAKADWQAVQDWFKANGHSVKDGNIPVDAHELWARGTERFLMEGKTPSSALRRVFDTFRSWLLHIYQVVDNLRSPITPEIRDVMQRLFATDEEIANANDQQQLNDLFSAAAEAGMSEQEFAAYKKIGLDARDEAHDQLLYKTMSSIRSARTKAWRDEAANVRAEITDRVNKRPEFRALELLRTGKTLGDPDAPAIKVKINRQWLIANYGEGVLSQLPGGVPPLYTENGAHPDEIAELAGFNNGDEMVRTLVTMQERKKELLGQDDKRSVKQALIDEETKAEMLDRHGDALSDGSIEEEALALVQNDLQGEKMATELRILGRQSNRTPTPYSMAKDWARTKIAESTVQEATSGSAIHRYSRTAAKAGKAAEQAMLAGDIDETFKQKQAQMLNNALVAEASRMRDAVEKARDRMAGYARRRTIKSMDQDYLDQIHALLEDVEFRPRTQASLERQQSFSEWAAAREAEGHDVVVPDSFAASLGQTHWTKLTVEKMLGLDDAIKQIAHLGRFKQELIDGAEKRAHEEVVAEAVGNIGNLPPRPPVKFDPNWSERMKARVDSIDAGLLKMETIVDWLDGGNSSGVFNRMAFRPIADAQAREGDMTADYFGRIRGAMSAVPNVGRWQERVTIPDLIDRETGEALQVTRQRLIAMALNMGNEGNIQRLTDGHGWNRDGVMTVLNRELTADDWTFVQSVWDTFETLWPEIAAMERRVNGVEPDKVSAVPVETSAGTLRGGYYPAVYDTARDLKAEQNAGKAGDLLEANYTRATTRASATKDRLNKVKRPILLDVGVINRHLGEVIHDITHREAIINAHKFLSDGRIQKAVNDTLGPEIRKQFQPWLKHVANQWASERSGNEGLGKFMGKLRANTTAVGMGFRASTVITQVAGLSNSQEVIGSTWLANASAQAAAHPVESWRFVTERSGEIRHRMDTLDRDIGALLRSLDLDPAKKVLGLPREAARFMYHGIGYADRMVVIPTWIAAYNKEIAAGADEADAIYAADKVVRQSQGSGAAKDLAAIQRGTGRWGEAQKFFTMFYSYFSAMYQRQRSLGRDVAGAGSKDVAKLLARAWWLLVVPAIMSQLLTGRGPKDDEDWGTWAFKQMLFNSLGTLPFVRDLAQPAWDKAAGNKSFGYQLSPVQRIGESIVNVAGDAGAALKGKETKHATKDVLETAGYTTGLVPGQIASATQFLVDVGYGSQTPEGVGEWYRGLTTGKAKPRQ
jgi:hypothetical protein